MTVVRRQEFAVQPAEAGLRLDRWLAAHFPGLSRTRLQTLVGEGHVAVNGVARKASARLKAGERITVEIPPPPPEALLPEEIPLGIVFEDDDLLVVDKPAGMVVHPGAGQRTGPLAAAVLAHAPSVAGVGGPGRPGIVHRLDKGTSGLLVVAKTPRAYTALTSQLAARSVSRRYLALVHGEVAKPAGVIEAPIGRDPLRRVRMAIRPAGRGKVAATRFSVLERFPRFTYLEARLDTGRTHQIRVHLASLGHPLVGDETYRQRIHPRPRDPELEGLVARLDGIALHAETLAFFHAVSGERLEFHSPLPERMARLLAYLRGRRPDRGWRPPGRGGAHGV
ncbi:MAG: RluA family pseudouridine synthase [Candidatus Methylomirabilia bacterium]